MRKLYISLLANTLHAVWIQIKVLVFRKIIKRDWQDAGRLFNLTIPSLEKTVPDNFKDTTRNYERKNFHQKANMIPELQKCKEKVLVSGGSSDLGVKLLFSVCFSRRVVSDLIGRDFNIFREKICKKKNKFSIF